MFQAEWRSWHAEIMSPTNLTAGSTKDDSRLERIKDAKPRNCPLCTQCHPLYRCEVFKSKPVAERRWLVYRKWICFHAVQNICLNYACNPYDAKYRDAESLNTHCFPNQVQHEEMLIIKQTTPKSQTSQPLQYPCRVSKVPPRAHADFNCSWSLRDFLQIIPLRIIGNDGRQTTT